MKTSAGNQALMLKAEALMLQALILLDESGACLPAAHLQSALDLLDSERPEASAPQFRQAGATPA